MIERINDVPEGVIGFEAVGNVTADDYRTTVIPAFEALRASGASARILYVIGSRFEHFSTGAMWADAKLEFQHVHWARAAVVTDVDWVHHLAGAFGWLVPGKFKTFGLDGLDAARSWVAGDD
jgi:hypothetical protein